MGDRVFIRDSDFEIVVVPDARTAFDAAETAYYAAARALQGAAHRLPDFFDPTTHGDSGCTHRDEHGEIVVVVVEPGYIRQEDVDAWDDDAKTMHGHTNGYDAWGESGLVEYLECPTWHGGCGLTWRMPDNFDWD